MADRKPRRAAAALPVERRDVHPPSGGRMTKSKRYREHAENAAPLHATPRMKSNAGSCSNWRRVGVCSRLNASKGPRGIRGRQATATTDRGLGSASAQLHESTFFSYGTAYAEGFCGAGRRRAKSVALTTVEPFDEPAPQNPPALMGCARAGARFVAPLDRCHHIALRVAPGGSPRPRAT
jgi:hypothetical protein